MSLPADIARALAQMGDPRFLGVFARAIGLTVLGLVAVFLLLVTLLGWILPETVSLPWIGEVGFVDEVLSWTAVGVLLVLSVFLMVPTAAAVIGFFLEDVAEAVERRHYPHLPPAQGPGIGQQIRDGIRFFGLVVAVNLPALAVYLLAAPLAPLVFWGVNGFLLGREYFQMVAVRRVSPEEAARLRRGNGARLWLAGTAMAIPLSVPLLNLVVPVLGAAVFTHQFHRIAGAAARKA